MQRKKNTLSKKIILKNKNAKIAIVTARFNEDITIKMQKGAYKTLFENGVKKENVDSFWAPGAFEIPLACQKLAESKKYDALIAIGAIIKGETGHYYYVAGEASRGIMEVMLKFSLPIGFGIITTNNIKQAEQRANGKSNKGSEAALAALEMVNL